MCRTKGRGTWSCRRAAKKQLGQHDDCPLGEDAAFTLLRMKQEVMGRGEQLIFAGPAGQRIKAVANSCGVNDIDRAQGLPVPGSLLEKLTF